MFLLDNNAGCQLMVIKMPSHAVGDACYRGIVGITYSVSRHPSLSRKASERPLMIYPYKHTYDFAKLR